MPAALIKTAHGWWLHLCPNFSYLWPLISGLCLLLSDSLGAFAHLCFCSRAEAACGSVSICRLQTNKQTNVWVVQPLGVTVMPKWVFPTETIPASPGAASAGPSPSFCSSLKRPSPKMVTSAPLEVRRQKYLSQTPFSRLNAASSGPCVFAQTTITWPSRLCARRAAWYEEYSPITDSMR